jgi:hypothetical protein
VARPTPSGWPQTGKAMDAAVRARSTESRAIATALLKRSSHDTGALLCGCHEQPPFVGSYLTAALGRGHRTGPVVPVSSRARRQSEPKQRRPLRQRSAWSRSLVDNASAADSIPRSARLSQPGSSPVTRDVEPLDDETMPDQFPSGGLPSIRRASWQLTHRMCREGHAARSVNPSGFTHRTSK